MRLFAEKVFSKIGEDNFLNPLHLINFLIFCCRLDAAQKEHF
tara:strand:+ start:950 stop:1075 length:126 start_codon:yes stop_codon:yes gene_type:complete